MMLDNQPDTPLRAVSLGLNDLVETVQRLHLIGEDRVPALRAKLKHLQRLGCPASSNTGTGRAARYEAAQVVEVSLALELTRVGLRAEEAVALLKAESWCVDLVRRQPVDLKSMPSKLIFLAIESDRERERTNESVAKRRVSIIESDGLMLPLAGIADHDRRVQAINMTGIARAIAGSLLSSGFDPDGLQVEEDDFEGVYPVEPFQF